MTGIPVRRDDAMTGEITLRGRVWDKHDMIRLLEPYHPKAAETLRVEARATLLGVDGLMIDRKEFEKRLRTLGPLSRLAQSEESGLRGGEAGGGGGWGR